MAPGPQASAEEVPCAVLRVLLFAFNGRSALLFAFKGRLALLRASVAPARSHFRFQAMTCGKTSGVFKQAVFSESFALALSIPLLSSSSAEMHVLTKLGTLLLLLAVLAAYVAFGSFRPRF